MKIKKGITLTELMVTSIISVFVVLSLLTFVKVAYGIYYDAESRTKIQTTANYIKATINNKVKSAKNLDEINAYEFEVIDSDGNGEIIKCVNDTMFFGNAKFYINDKTDINFIIINSTSEMLEYSLQISDDNIDTGTITTTVRRKNITTLNKK